MIPIAQDFDLGRDTARMKDPRDAARQRHTVEVLLERMFHPDPDRRWEVQLLADEVGMGKTFVALALAYSILSAMHNHTDEPDLQGCSRRVLVIVPQNESLYDKWIREVGEFVKRCMPEHEREQAASWFAPQKVDRLDDIPRFLRKDGGPEVLVTSMSVLAPTRKLQHYDLKRRFLLGVLFRFWGVRFQRDARERLLRGAPEGWPKRPDDLLTSLSPSDWELLPFASEAEVLAELRAAAPEENLGQKLDRVLGLCKELGEPYCRSRGEAFPKLERELTNLYRHVCCAGVTQHLPLVIVDEAHNWKNGPKQKTNGYGGFEDTIGPRTRRVLLLTATPFQLKPREMMEVLRVGSVIAPCPSPEESRLRCERIDGLRDRIIGPVLDNASRQSRLFAAAWSRLPLRATRVLEQVWCAPDQLERREELRTLAHQPGVVGEAAMDQLIDQALVGQDPEVKDILREGLRLYAYNEDLSQELGVLVIRHRRRTDHRLVRVGAEFSLNGGVPQRSDRHVLHAAPGIDVRGPGELPHYLLMRCVSEGKRGRGRTSLGAVLTGCYSTLLESAEGKDVRTKLAGEGVGRVYLDLLLKLVAKEQDPDHPKVRALVDSVLESWRAGEKCLIFCFRTHTARRLKDILADRLNGELTAKQTRVLGGSEALTRLRNRFTRRDGDLIALGLDRVLWSLRWAARSEDVPLPLLRAEDLRLNDDEMAELARLGLRYGVELRHETVDRVFIHRVVEHLVARRLKARGTKGGYLFRQVLDCMADENWVRCPYGIEPRAAEEDGEREASGLDERGIHTVYDVAIDDPNPEDVEAAAAYARDRRERAQRQDQVSVFDAYAEAPSFWLGRSPESLISSRPSPEVLAELHKHLLRLTRHGVELDWTERMAVLQALRRALMRESILLRILPERTELEEHAWGELLTDRFFSPLPGQLESMADRLTVFVQDLQAAHGKVSEPGTERHAMYEATRLRGAETVVLVDGSTAQERRKRVFAGFNSPLLPEVMVCTSVGQEGIDLHRHCRQVVHYDLAWNPAVLEQRTGRVDRIGSKTFRERAASSDQPVAARFLDVAVPFLAGTYDERMYEELRIRAQVFEVLTGGDVSSDNLEGSDEEPGAEGAEEGLSFPELPQRMISDLRVRLHVWEEKPGTDHMPGTVEVGSSHKGGVGGVESMQSRPD